MIPHVKYICKNEMKTNTKTEMKSKYELSKTRVQRDYEYFYKHVFL